jgi:uncharacterized membrane protein YbhN (UPF0104 family)
MKGDPIYHGDDRVIKWARLEQYSCLFGLPEFTCADYLGLLVRIIWVYLCGLSGFTCADYLSLLVRIIWVYLCGLSGFTCGLPVITV